MTHLCREEMVLQYRLSVTSHTSQNSWPLKANANGATITLPTDGLIHT